MRRTSKPLARRTRLASVSTKRRSQNRTYTGLRREFLAERPLCELCSKLPRRAGARAHQRRATDVHHRKGRIGEMLLRVEFWSAACRPCHDWLHENGREARELGLLV